MDAILSIIPLRTFAQNVMSTKNIVLPEISSKGVVKVSLVKLRTKCCCKPWEYCKCKVF